MCMELFFQYLNPRPLCFTFPLAVLLIVMSVFSLNQITVTVTLDCGYPASLVTRRVASCLDTLAELTVACRPIQALPPFNCILAFGTADDLPSDCVLGRDYFTCLSAVLCEHLSHFFLSLMFHSPTPSSLKPICSVFVPVTTLL